MVGHQQSLYLSFEPTYYGLERLSWPKAQMWGQLVLSPSFVDFANVMSQHQNHQRAELFDKRRDKMLMQAAGSWLLRTRRKVRRGRVSRVWSLNAIRVKPCWCMSVFPGLASSPEMVPVMLPFTSGNGNRCLGGRGSGYCGLFSKVKVARRSPLYASVGTYFDVYRNTGSQLFVFI